ncbi:hypothetical protein FRC02_012039 [Tulasnella sp. 418]|nr:hypothetical protein FRC02_012039 [Tulasnella sp. 418]
MSQSYFPIDNLAVEILCHIFSLCCEAEFADTAPIEVQTVKDIIVIQGCSPLTLSHVSSRWRTIAQQLRSIWSLIRVKDDTPAFKIWLWLEHSGNHPLDILIHDVHPNRVRQAYNILAPHASRWRRFRVLADGSSSCQGPREWHITPFLRKDSNEDLTTVLSAPELTVLELRKRHYNPTHNCNRIRDRPSLLCPKLQTLIVSEVALDWSQSGLHIPLNNITILEMCQMFHDT